MTDNELDQLMQRVLLDAIKNDCEKENSVASSFKPSLRYQRSLAAMISDPLKWAHKRAKPLWKKVLKKVAIVLIVFSLSLGSLMVVSPSIRAAVVNWVTEWYETHVTYRYSGAPIVETMPQYEITALPNGYEEDSSQRIIGINYVGIVYRNSLVPDAPPIYFDYIYMQQGTVYDQATDVSTISDITVNGMKGHFYLSKDMGKSDNTITWIDPEHNIQFSIDAMLCENSMLHTAESVSLVNSPK